SGAVARFRGARDSGTCGLANPRRWNGDHSLNATAPDGMTAFSLGGQSPLQSAKELEAALRQIGAERYHNLHPFHRLLHGGRLNKGQVQAWALNRYCYQSAIPRKDAALIARADDSDLRRTWRQRLVDHDGDAPGSGGIVRWLALT